MPIVETEFVCSPFINFALQQNQVPVIRKLLIKNISDHVLQNISVEIISEPNFAASWTHQLEGLDMGESFELESINLNMVSDYLFNISERVQGSFTLEIKSDSESIFKEIYPIAILAYDQWSGIFILPEMLSAFITPNHSEVLKIVRKAATILEKWTGNPSFNEYQSKNPDRVKKQMAAIYEAIAAMQLVYCSVPAGFEQNGQRIRLCDTIFEHKLANCLDLSLLYAACLEAIGLNPLIVIIKGHAFVGGWLIDESFADPVNEDPSLLSKRIVSGINEITLVEATCMNAGNNTSFDEAENNANAHLINEENFVLFLDIKRSRFSGIRPLPLRIHTQNGWEIIEEENEKNRSGAAPEKLSDYTILSDVEEIKVSKQRLWERKLLDLTLRNNLLNFRVTKSALQFISINLSSLEDALSDGAEFQVLPKPNDWDNPLRSAGIYQSVNKSDPITDLVKHEFSQKRLRSYLTENELLQSLTNIYRSSRQSIDENGANTLFIALGMLKYFETVASERPRYAPIMLLPVEIVRKSAQKGYVIRSREEDTMMNITLLEMLRQDFGINIGGLENLPKDERGIDVKLIFNIIRKSIMTKDRWDVEEQAFLGTFSFSKFILWNDIHHNSDKLTRNKIVKSLISGKLEWQVSEQADEVDFDKTINPVDIALPISSDSSQFEAILSSARNESFILHGPPGTGKSQTITNIIANALYSGKKVLFVAAKKAALEVVQKRLESIGIGDFCLELHSNKSKKSAVLEQLKLATEITRKVSPENFQSEADRLFAARNELNGYVDALHKKHPFGLSLFDVFTQYSQSAETPDSVNFDGESIKSLTAETLIQWNDLARELQVIGTVCRHPFQNPLEVVQVRQYSQQIKNDATQALNHFISLLNSYQTAFSKACTILKLQPKITDGTQAQTLVDLTDLLLNLPDIPGALFKVDHAEQMLSKVIGVAENGKKRDLMRSSLLKNFNKSILEFSAAQTLSDWNIASDKWFLSKFLKQNAIAKELKKMTANENIDKQEIPDYLHQIIQFQEEQSKISQATFLPEILGFLWKNGECDWEQLEQIANDIIAVNKQNISLNTVSKAKEWRDNLAKEFSEGSQIYFNYHRKDLEELVSVSLQINNCKIDLHQKLGIEFSSLKSRKENWIENNLLYAEQWLSAIDYLRDWISWLQIKDKAINAGLHPLVTAYENGGIKSDEVVNYFKKGLNRSLAEFIINNDPQLSNFNGKLFEEKIKKFKEISNNFEQLTRDELYARLAAKIPFFAQEASQSSEIGILQRNIRNHGRATSIRKLFDSIPNLLPRLMPCMLMSPISVAQYFDTSSEKFDLVVFDEASQLPTCEAIGAIARATNVIVVGDPKQMPPTNFFSSNNIDDDNIELEDLESILDDCLALSMPSYYLLWHYRSKHESLIAFSNAKYYGNKLLTFPSTDDITTKVTHVPVKGYYDKGKTRQNQFEAKAIVDEVVRRLSDKELAKKSIGIVTFSVVQQTLIDDLLNEVFKSRPDIEKIALESDEPIFIKNLENVQGDERDVILFSIGYGPDKEGKLSLNFGPINREGGWRRLNVAVSRARYEMKIFSTLQSDQIDITRTSSEGVAGLKAFLAFAEKGKSALPARSAFTNGNEGSFEKILSEEIKKLGYEVHDNIGCSDYKIDVGVVNPANPDEYILGILCDGYNYHKAKTSRDREIVQMDVLRTLGWSVHKVWSAEWWENPQKIMNEIVQAIKQSENNKIEQLRNTIEESLSENKKVEVETELALKTSYQPQIADDKPLHSSSINYQVCNLEIVLAKSSDDFLQLWNKSKVEEQILQVLEIESPISKSLLIRRVLGAWGISRSGSRVSNHIEMLLSRLNLEQTKLGKNSIFWKKNHHPDDYSVFRISENEAQKREADDLPPEEIANGVKEILTNQISLPKSELVRETSRLFGYARIGANVEGAMLAGINQAIQKGYAVDDGDKVVVK